MKRYIYLFLFIYLMGNISGQNKENSQTEKQWLTEFSKKSIERFFNAISLPDTVFYEPVEWILIVQDVLYPINIKGMEMELEEDTLRGCIKLLDNRGDFEQYYEISEVPNAFVAVSLSYNIISKHTGAKVESYETTFILDNEGTILEVKDYVSPIAVRQKLTMQILDMSKSDLIAFLEEDITNLEWELDPDTQNWVLQKNNKNLFQWTPLELAYIAQKCLRKKSKNQ